LPFVVLLVILAGAGIAFKLWLARLLDGPASDQAFEATLIVRRGTPYHEIVKQLREKGLLRHPFVFDYLSWKRGDASKIRPGRYGLKSSMSARMIYDRLLQGAPIRITVPEGWTLRQIADRLVREQLTTSAALFLDQARDTDFLERHGILAATAEGYLLPETYHFDPGITTDEILNLMIGSFKRRYAAEARMPRPEAMSWHQVVTLASMIEREARNEEEKPLIASVYCNRLRRKMSPDCDATIRYALSKWNAPLTDADLKTSSPYNTYLRKGLPPGPIGTVGRGSLLAALRPAPSEYLYYCYKGDNSHYFSKTLREHNAAVKKYLRDKR
jgi:UPF0755 protein